MQPIPRTLFADEHDQFRAAFRSWLDNEVVPNHEQWERDEIVPRSIWLEAGKHGFLGLAVPEQFGGGGVDDFRFGAIMGEEIGDAGVIGSGNGFTLHNDIVLPYFTGLCNDEQQAAMAAGHGDRRADRRDRDDRAEHRQRPGWRHLDRPSATATRSW